MPDAYDDVPHYGVKVSRALEAMEQGRYAEAANGLEWAATAAFGAGDTMEAKISGNNAVTAFAKGGDSSSAQRIATHLVDLFRDANLAVLRGVGRQALSGIHPLLRSRRAASRGPAWSRPGCARPGRASVTAPRRSCPLGHTRCDARVRLACDPSSVAQGDWRWCRACISRPREGESMRIGGA
jgi:hypothetical protein